jgi:AbiV family abortive infection protein
MNNSRGPVAPEFLLRGAVHAVEQCGLLLRDANVLYRSNSYASAIVLAAFAREELGRSRILLDLRRQALAGASFTTADVKDACEDHLIKQEAGMLSTTMRTDRDSGLGKILHARVTNPPQSKEWRKADAELKRIDEALRKRTPNDRHNKRIAALYVEPRSANEWNRPATTLASEARDFLIDAVNEYSGQHERFSPGSSVLKDIDPEMYEALESWPGRPELQPPLLQAQAFDPETVQAMANALVTT